MDASYKSMLAAIQAMFQEEIRKAEKLPEEQQRNGRGECSRNA